MKKLSFLIFAATLTLTLQAQQKTTPAKKPTTGSTSAGSKLTTQDANDIITYNNSIRIFLGSEDKYLRLQDFATFYNRAADQVHNTDGTRPAAKANPVSDRNGNFDEAYKSYMSDIKAARKELVDIYTPPKQIKQENITYFKTKLDELKVANQACFEQYKVCEKYFRDYFVLRDKSQRKEIAEQLDLLATRIEALYTIEEEISDRMEVIGDMAEEVTLAKHPMKKEIFDMRKALRINNQVQKIIQSSSDASITENSKTLDSLSSELEKINAKYKTYDANKGPGSQAMRIAVSSFFAKEGTQALVAQIKKAQENASNPKELTQTRGKVKYAGYVMTNSYDSFLRANNAGQ